jgi:hypothetical protein
LLDVLVRLGPPEPTSAGRRGAAADAIAFCSMDVIGVVISYGSDLSGLGSCRFVFFCLSTLCVPTSCFFTELDEDVFRLFWGEGDGEILFPLEDLFSFLTFVRLGTEGKMNEDAE